MPSAPPTATRKLPRGRLYLRPVRAAAAVLRHLPSLDGPGPATARLEAAVGARLGVQHVVALPHCRTALWLALRGLGLPPGSAVALTPVTVPGIVQAIRLAGLQPWFVDLAPGTANLDVDGLERDLPRHVRALLVTHLCGLPTAMDRVADLARRRGLVLLEDVSQALGATFAGRPLGTFGRAAVASTSTMKPVSGLHGGLLLTADPDLAGAARTAARSFAPPRRRDVLAWLGRELAMDAVTRPPAFAWLTWPLLTLAEERAPARVAEFQRGNVLGLARRREPRLPATPPAAWCRQLADAQAALALDGLAALDAGNARRRDLGLHLHARLRTLGVPGLPHWPQGAEPVFWRFPLWSREPEALRRHLRRHGVDSARTNLQACHRLADLGCPGLALPEAEAFVDRTTFLPMHPDLTEADMDAVAAAVATCPEVACAG